MDTAYRRLLHKERCFEQVLRISPRIVFFALFFIFFFCLHSKRSFGFRRTWSLIPLRETTLQRSFIQLTIVSRLFFHLPQHHMAGSGAGIWMHLQLAGTRYRRLVLFWPFSFRHLWFSRKRRTRSNARRSAQVRDRNFTMESSLISSELSFFLLSFYMFGLERLLGRYPPARTTPEFNNSNRHILCFFPWLFPIYDDSILMTTFLRLDDE